MKRYVVLCLIVYLLLLLMPLSALGSLEKDKPPASSASAGRTGTTSSSKTTAASNASATTSSAGTTATTSATAAPVDEAVFRVLDTETGKVTSLGEREFVIGTVASELYPTYHTEAMKAQAVASYTYYSLKRAKARQNPNPDLKGADFSDVPATFPETYTVAGLKERWGDNFDAYYKKVTEAVDAVFGKRVLYNGEPIYAFYHALNSGVTEDAKIVWEVEYPYLKPVASPGDKLSPNFQTVVSFTPEQLSTSLRKTFDGIQFPENADTWLGKDIARSSSGTVTNIAFCGKELTGKQVREALDLKSTCFSVEYKNNSFQFTVQGYGHGVGMSQYGADYMARQGSTWQEILTHYYTGVTIQ